MAYLQFHFGIFLLLAASRGQKIGVASISENTTTTIDTNENVTAKVDTEMKPSVIKETLITTVPKGNVTENGLISMNKPDTVIPVGKEDPQIAGTQVKNGEGLGPSFIAEPDAIKKDLGGKCHTDKECLTVNNTYCKDNVCVCNNGFIPSKHSLDKCVKVPSGMFDVCEEEAQCSHAVKGSECREGHCDCPPNYIFKLNQCWEKQMLGGLCNITEQCEDIPSAVCTQGVCDCQPPLVASPSNKCLEVAGKEYKAICEEDIQCSLSYGDEARCSHGQCICTNNYHHNGTTCIIDKKLGEFCSADSQCEVSDINNEEAVRICLDKICTCAIGYINLPGEDICSKSSGNTLAMSLSWILCFTLVKFYLE